MLSINYRDPRPIYEQIKDGLRKLLISGVIKTEEKLPSVRELAAELAINPNTIQRVYRELEAEGYIYSVSGKGTFSCGISEIDMKRKTELESKLKEMIQELFYMNTPQSELHSLIYEIYGREDN